MFIFSYGMGDASAVSPVYVSTHGNNNWNGLSPTHIQGTSIGPKATIKNAAKTVKSGGALHIASGIYKENNITINKNMYIIGAKQSNTIIDGNNKGSIFHITSNVVKVSIHNLTIINTKTTRGAAIENNGRSSNLYIDKCSFTNNTGRAIYNIGDGSTVTIKNTIFSKNSVAIYNYADNTIRLTNCSFTNNKGKNNGNHVIEGVISNTGVLYVDKCKFTNNPTVTISNDDRGAVAYVTCSNFTNNTCAIETHGGLEVTGCNFTRNTKSAILNDRVAKVTRSNFVGNNAADGGAIYNIGEAAFTVTNSTFINNTATDNGGAIYNIATARLKVSNCTFINNTATGNGGSIYSDDGSDLNVTSCNFNNNTAKGVGGAIYTYGGTVNFNRLIGDKNYELYNNGTNSLDARYNWWGSNNPDFSNLVSGVVNTTPWMVLTINANPTTINNGGNSTIVADLLHDSNGAYHSPLSTHLHDGIRVRFSSDGKGSVNPKVPVNGMVAGKATTTFTAGIPGTSFISATVDNQTVTTQVNISA